MKFIKLTSPEDRPMYVDASRIAWFREEIVRGDPITVVELGDGMIGGGATTGFGSRQLHVKESAKAILLLVQTIFQ